MTEASASVRTWDLGVGRSAYAAAGASRGSRYGVKSGMLATVVAVSLMLVASACIRGQNVSGAAVNSPDSLEVSSDHGHAGCPRECAGNDAVWCTRELIPHGLVKLNNCGDSLHT